MPTFNDGESGGSVRTKINDAINKVDGMEANATADQTGAEMRTLLAAEPDTNILTNTLLANIRTLEEFQDLVAAMLQGGSHTNMTVTYDDVGGVIDLAATGGGGGAPLTQEQVEDFVAGVSTAGNGISVTYDDAANTLTFALTGETFTTADRNKLIGIATGATANTGALADLNTVGTAQIDNGSVTIGKISATGSASSSTFLRGDGVWVAPAGGGDVTKVGTPANNQLGIWTGDGTIEGDVGLTWDGSTLSVTGDIDLNGTTLSGTALADPGGNRGLGWDDSEAAGDEVKFWSAGTGLSFDASFNLNADIASDVTGVAGADAVGNIISLTTAEYGAITPNATTIYLITDA